MKRTLNISAFIVAVSLFLSMFTALGVSPEESIAQESDITLLSVTSGGETIYPIGHLSHSVIWYKNPDGSTGWLSADGVPFLFEEISDDFPFITLDSDITISQNPGFHFMIMSEWNASWNGDNGVDFTYEKLSKLEPGSYFVRFRIWFQLEYVPEGDGYNKIAYDYYFKLIVPSTDPVLSPSYQQEWENPFADINSSDWFYDSVKYVVIKDLFNGTDASFFKPHGTMTRAMFTQVLANLEGVNLSEYNSSRFNDVPDEAWYMAAVEWAADKGIVSGYSNNMFGSDDNVTREQMAVMLNNYIQYKGITFPVLNNPATFVDENEISNWALEEVKAIQAIGVISGKPGNLFDPNALATRSEAASLFARFLGIMEP